MLIDSAEVAIPVGATINVFQGRPIEFVGAPSVASLAIVSEEAGLTMSWTINVAGIQHVPIAAGSPINGAGPGIGPKEDEDTVITGVAMPAGARNALNVTATAQATVPTVIRYRAVIQP
jgi:hypothetical protein